MMKNASTLMLCLLLSVAAFMSSCEKSLSPETELGEGLCIYAVNPSSLPEDNYVMDVSKAEIAGDPIISYSDIASYDIDKHTLTLTVPHDFYTRQDLFGTPFVVTLDSEKIYGGWFWSSLSSAICNWVVINLLPPTEELEENQIRITLGYPNESFFVGFDPRNHPRILNRLAHDGKAK